MSPTPERLPLEPSEYTRLNHELDLMSRDLTRISERVGRAFGKTATDPILRARAGLVRARDGLAARYSAVMHTTVDGPRALARAADAEA